METSILTFQNKTINGNFRCYLKNGELFFNLEDVAFGLGYTSVGRNLVERVKWDKVKSVVREFGHDTQGLGKGSYVEEKMFYILAMHATNEAAKKFQMWVADILKSIRQDGYYIADNLRDALFQRERPGSKVVRKSETGAIKMYIQYAREQGDRREEDQIYAWFSKLANRAAGIPDGRRGDPKYAEWLWKVMMTDNAIANLLIEGMARGQRYTQIENDVYIFITRLTNIALRNNPLLPTDDSTNMPAPVS